MKTYETIELLLEIRDEEEQTLLLDDLSEEEKVLIKNTITYIDFRIKILALQRLAGNLERRLRGLPGGQM